MPKVYFLTTQPLKQYLQLHETPNKSIRLIARLRRKLRNGEPGTEIDLPRSEYSALVAAMVRATAKCEKVLP
jgi:hypothetical protein